MFLKEVKMVGFKSFADKTSLNFQEGTTVVVGPNGCGKSNLTDAIQWVLGEQRAKQLRGENMQDVIFSGTNLRPASGMAEVSITFDNSHKMFKVDYDEVCLTRRLFRSGESDYLINGQSSRLKDIQDLLMDSGVGKRAYAIIKQGQIARFLQAKPEERRVLIEEAAGIAKYRTRRAEAMRKLDVTRDNLTRIEDIASEVEKNLARLQRQAKKAERYREYADELRAVEIAYTLAEDNRLVERAERLSAEEERLQGEAHQAAAAREDLDEKLDQKKIERVAIDERVSAAQRRYYSLENHIQSIEMQKERVGDQRGSIEEHRRRLRSEIELLQGKIEQLNTDIESLHAGNRELEENSAEVERLLSERGEEESRVSEARRNLAMTLEESKEKQIKVLQDLAAFHTRLSALSEQIESTRRRTQELSARRTECQARRERDAQMLEEQRGILAELAEAKSSQRETARAAEENFQTLRAQLAAAEDDLKTAELEHSRLDSRLAAVSEWCRSMEGYTQGVRDLAGQNVEGIVGVLGERIRAEKEAEAAVAAALGSAVEHLVIEDEEALWRVASAISGENARVTLAARTPEAPALEPPAFADEPGYKGRLLEYIDADPADQNVVSLLLSNAFLVENLEAARRCRRRMPRHTLLVTLAGEVVTGWGSLTVGEKAAETSILTHLREKDELTVSAAEALKHCEHLKNRRDTLRFDLTQAEINHKEAASVFAETQKLLSERELEIKRVENDQKRLDEEIASIESEIASFTADAENAEREITEMTAAVADGENARSALEREMGDLRSRLEQQSGEQARLEAVLTDLRLRSARCREQMNANARQIRTYEQMRTQHEDGIRRYEEELTNSEGRDIEFDRLLEDLSEQKTALLTEREEAHAELSSVEWERQALEEAVSHLEEERRAVEQRERHLGEQIHSSQLVRTEIESQRVLLAERIRDHYKMEISSLQSADYPLALEHAEAAERVTELRAKIENLGGINFEAMEECKELEERAAFYQEHRDDLRCAERDLMDLVETIDTHTTKLFNETFSAVNNNFGVIFQRLFEGGEAELVLTDPENPLESGVDVIARPPGKRLQSISLLSGGEQALTTIALLFSLFLVKPSPFCIMDEVDAPLDDVNVGRFARILKEFARKTQFVVVTHNKQTMELGDALFGVTMQEKGVSSLISVRIEDGAKMAEGSASASAG